MFRDSVLNLMFELAVLLIIVSSISFIFDVHILHLPLVSSGCLSASHIIIMVVNLMWQRLLRHI